MGFLNPRSVAVSVALGVLTTLALACLMALIDSPRRATSFASKIELNSGERAGTWYVEIYQFTGPGASRLTLAGLLEPCDSEDARRSVEVAQFHRSYEIPVRRQPRWARLGRISSRSGGIIDTQGAWGWPLHAVWRSVSEFSVPSRDSSDDEVAAAAATSQIELAGWTGPTARVASGVEVPPFGLIWSGFAIDSAVFGVFWLLVMVVAVQVRTVLRRMRDHCPTCNYSLRGLRSGRCPECGAQAGSMLPVPS